MEKILFLAPYFLSLFISIWIAIFAWRHRQIQGASAYAAYVAAQSLWVLEYIFELLSPTLQGKIFWDATQWLSVTLATITFPIFVARYTDAKIPRLKTLFTRSLIIHPLFLLILFTDSYHGLLYPNPTLEQSFLFAELRYDFTWVIYIYGAYNELITLICIGILIKSLVSPQRLYRRQILTVILGVLLPFITTIMTLMGVDFEPFRDISPISFAVGNTILTWGLFHYKLFDVVPIARDLVFDKVDDLVIVLDSQDRVVDMNQNALRALAMTPKQVIGQSVQSVYKNTPQILARFREPENFRVQISLPQKDKIHHYDVRSTLLHNKKGMFTGRVFVATDISEYIEMQETLRELNNKLEKRVQERTAELSRSMEQYRLVVENQTEFIVRWKPDRTRTFVNEAYCHYFGLTREEAMQIDFLQLIYEEDRPLVLEKIAITEKGENSADKDIHRVIRADGSIGWNEWTDTPIYNKDGKITEYQSVGRDITNTKRAELALERSEIKHRLLFESANDGIFLLQGEYFTDCNSKTLEIFQCKREDIIGKTPIDFSPPFQPDGMDSAEKSAQRVKEAQEGKPQFFEWQHLRLDGTLFDAEVSLNLLNLEDETFIQAIVRDITDRKEAERKLVEAYDNTLEGWAKALELRDTETEGHTRRVTELTVKLAQVSGISEDDLDDIRRGAILHDIGKMAIPDSILLKPSSLTPKEWQIMSQHPEIGYKLLSSIEFLENSLDIVLYHHERWDGKGYPKGLKGEEIPLPARIFAIIDVWDAVQSKRPYKEAWSREKALALIKDSAGSHFDPQSVEKFLTLVEKNENAAPDG